MNTRTAIVARIKAAQEAGNRAEANNAAYELAAFDAAQRRAAKRNGYYR